MQVSKLMQVFTRQAAMIDALIAHFTEQIKKRKQEANATEQTHDGKSLLLSNAHSHC